MDSKSVDKIKAIFLNKVDGLEWYYFNINLNETLLEPANRGGGMQRAALPGKTGEAEDLLSMTHSINFLKEIEADLDSYRYTGDEEASMRDVLRSLLCFTRERPAILKEVARRIYDLNEIPNRSKAHEGRLGLFNTKDNRRRNKVFYRKMMKESFRQNPDNITIVAEGDSWFQFPSLFLGYDPVKDVIDWLMDDERMAVFSLASGGDWLSNILYTGEYIEALPRIGPDVLLISGGGNDLVGDMRLSTMVRNPLLEGPRRLESPKFQELLAKRKAMKGLRFEHYKIGLKLLSDEFFDFLNLAMTQYFLFFYNLVHSRRYEKMLIITQGYDFIRPGKPAGRRGLKQWILNKFMKNGERLHAPLSIKGITQPDQQKAVMYAMITEFNEMLCQLANYDEFKNVYHIDCRGLAKPEDWFDELHLKGRTNRIIADTFKKCIDENLRKPGHSTTNVYRAADTREQV